MSDLEWEPILDDKGCCPHGNYDWRSCVRCHGHRIPVPEAENAEPEAENAEQKEATQALVNRMKQLDRVGTKLPDVNALTALVEGSDHGHAIAILQERIDVLKREENRLIDRAYKVANRGEPPEGAEWKEKTEDLAARHSLAADLKRVEIKSIMTTIKLLEGKQL